MKIFIPHLCYLDAVNSNPVATDLVHRVQDGNRAAVSTTNNSTSSGDESSEEDWLPNWSLNLYNALNPTVITTGEKNPLNLKEHCNKLHEVYGKI